MGYTNTKYDRFGMMCILNFVQNRMGMENDARTKS